MAEKKTLGNMAGEINWLKVGFFLLIAAAIVMAYNFLFGHNGIFASLWGSTKKGAEWLVEETGDYINQQVKIAHKGYDVLKEEAGNIYDSEKARIEAEIKQAEKGLEIIKTGAFEAYDYLKNLWP